MPEEGIETQELKERLEDAQEEARGLPWLTWLSLSTAILLHQSKADDGWAYYQAKGIEKTVYATQVSASAPREPCSSFLGCSRDDPSRPPIARPLTCSVAG
jgi:hypothetical protein